MTNTVQLEVTEQELVAILYALQERSNNLLESMKNNQRLDIAQILARMFESNTSALAQVEKKIETSYSYI